VRVHRLWPVTAWLLAASSLLSPVVSGDVIRVHNTANDDVGALVDGLRAGIAVNDARYLKLNLGGFINGLFPIVPLEEFTPAPQSNEAIVFARGRPPLLLDNLNWSVFDDTIHANFDDEYAIDVRIWIVHGPFETVRNVALNAGVVTSTIWEHERQGIKFSNFEVTDATDDPDAPGLLDFPPFCEGAEELQTRIGFEPGMVNIYYVRTVDFGSGPGTTSGVWCGSERIIAMGYQTSGPLLAHELGHSFFLGHLSPWPEHFDTSNVMEHSSPNREFLTEGQTFRTVYQPLSSINNIYDVRTGKPTRNCPQGVSDTDLDCPGLHKRLWEDGAAWPPN
jgi:hypothetical protein